MQPTLADRNNNPGNIRDTQTGHFKVFKTPQEGFGALMNDLEAKKTGNTSTGLHGDSNLAEFASKYAPAGDNNNPAQYAANLANHMGVRPDTKLKDLDTGAWAEAIAKNEGYSAAKDYKPRQPKQIQPTEQPVVEQPQEQGGAAFKYNPNDNPLVSGLKTAGNLPGSALDFGKGIVQSVNPTNIIKNFSDSLGEMGAVKKQEGGTWNAVKAVAKEIPGQTYKALIPEGIRNLFSGLVKGGNLQDATKQFVENPVGNVAPVILAGEGLAKGADTIASKSTMKGYVKNIGENFNKPIPKPTTTYSDAFNKGIQKTSSLVTKPVEGLINKTGNVVKSTGLSFISKISGLDPQTIGQIISNPSEFSRIAREETSRGGLANEVKDAIDTRINDLSETGKGYENIKNTGNEATVGFIKDTNGIRPLFIDDALKSSGFEIRNGKIQANTNSVTRNSADINAINKFYKDWGNKKSYTPNEFLNMRSDLAELAKYDKITGTGKTGAIEKIASDLRSSANDKIRPQFKGLKELDDQYSPEVKFLKQVKKDFVNPDGTLKDNAPSKIANSPNKAELTKRLENIMPGITKRIEILKAVEDIERSSGIKVGTYGTAATALAGFLTAGPIGVIISQILTTPENAVQILKAAGHVDKATLRPIIQTLRILSGNVNTSGGMIAEKSPFTTGLIGQNTKVNNQ